jgi:hypothetical protein
MPKNRKSYTSVEKLEIVGYAERNNNRSAARLYGVDEKQVRNWRKEKTILQAMKPTKRARRLGKERWPELELDLKKWIMEEREQKKRVFQLLVYV